MKKYISTLLGHNSESTAWQAQNMTALLAKQEGYDEVKIYPHHREGEPESESLKRVDHALDGIESDALFILQVPTWNQDLEYDEMYLRELRYRVKHLVIFVHDFIPLMFTNNLGYTEGFLRQYNQADLVILPSRKMEAWMRQFGLTAPVVIQGLWDHYTPFDLPTPTSLYRGLRFPAGSAQRAQAVQNWHFDTPLDVYTRSIHVDVPEQVNLHSYLPQEALLLELNQGGFGLVWADNTDNMPTQEYYTMCHPYKLSTYLAAGLPLVLQKGATSAAFVQRNGLGFVVESLEEAARLVRDISDEEYRAMLERVAPVAQMVREGFFFKKLLLDIEGTLFLKKEDENGNL